MAAALNDGAMLRLRPITEAVGAEVIGCDVRRLDGPAFAAVRDAFFHHGALLFRGQELGDDDLIAFARRWGELDHAPVMENGRTAVPGKPEIYVISNVLGADGRPIGSLGAGEAVWHTDMSYLPVPPMASMLHALEVPPSGGDTWLLGMGALWDALPADLKDAVRGRSIKHDGTYNSGGYVRAGVTATDDPRESVGHPHPIVCRIPETGREVLLLGRRRNAWVVGLPLDESEALLDALWSHVDRPELSFAHRWRVGDLLMWDNRATMHRRDAFDATARRVMHRTQVKGRRAPEGV
jgi:taurine dioxygenase